MMHERSRLMQFTEERPVATLAGVVKEYPGFRLGPIDFALEPGFVTAVVGPNGSGKSTLFRMMMNLARPDAGDLSLFGGRYPGGDYPDGELEIKQRIGYVPERAVGHDDWSAAELGRFHARWYPEWNDRLYKELLGRFEIPAGRQFQKLSKGLQRRLSFALARSSEPELMLLDEPTDGVDPFARRLLLDEISEYMHPGDRTVLFATHVMEEVRRLADYIVFLRGGEFLGFYEKDALLEEWRALWVGDAPQRDTPGLVNVEDTSPVRVVTRSLPQTRESLRRQGLEVLRSEALPLEEILEHLMSNTRKRGANL